MKSPNHLQGQSSPYLLQHLYNPVDWHPWGEEALAKAKAENKPILVSIGYASCHWCHVMEKESFENAEVAMLMNKNFVCIKVDREERPDVDHTFMNAIHVLGMQGGWPLNVFALPDGRPFWGGTYFPVENWMEVLTQIRVLFDEHQDKVLLQAGEIYERLQKMGEWNYGEAQVNYPALAERMTNSIKAHLDPVDGGLSGSPKFPMPDVFGFLLSASILSHDEELLNMVKNTLYKMGMGGIFDQIGGGFARYSTDKKWKVPHFEKMLYDNASLISLYSQAFVATKEPFFERIINETLNFVFREMTASEGTFYSAIDADSQGEEGLFYLWTEQEFQDVLGDEAPLFMRYWRVGQEGLWETGRNILLQTVKDEDFAKKAGLSTSNFLQLRQEAAAKLLAARSKRQRPITDNKSIVAWNGMMIKALCDAASALHRKDCETAAIKCAESLISACLKPDGKLLRILIDGKAHTDAFLDDYAFLSNGLLALYELTGDEKWFEYSSALASYVLKHFSDGSPILLFNHNELTQPLVPIRELHDNVIPSCNAVMAKTLWMLGHLSDDTGLIKNSSTMLSQMHELMHRYPSSFSYWGQLALCHAYPYFSFAITGPQASEFQKDIKAHPWPNKMVVFSKEKSSMPVFQNRFAENKNLIYLCRAQSCLPAVESTSEALDLLENEILFAKM